MREQVDAVDARQLFISKTVPERVMQWLERTDRYFVKIESQLMGPGILMLLNFIDALSAAGSEFVFSSVPEFQYGLTLTTLGALGGSEWRLTQEYLDSPRVPKKTAILRNTTTFATMSSILPITLFATLYPNEALANAQNPMSASLLLLTPLLSGFIRKRALGSHYQEASLDVLQNPNQRGLDSVLEAIPSLANAISAYVATISGPASLMFFIPVVSTLARSLRAQHRMRQYALAENTAIERWRNRCGTINRWTIALCVATVLVTVVLRVVNSEEDAAFASSRLWIVIPLVIMTLFRFVVDLFCSNSRGNQETLVTDISEGEISTMSDVGTQFPERFSSNDDLAEERLVEEALPPYLFYRRVSSTFIGRESEENVDTIDSL